MRTLVVALLLPLVLAGIHAADAQPNTTSVTLQVYEDGTVSVSQVVAVPANDTSVDLQLLSSLIANPVATDQNGSSLFFQITGSNITVYTVGATRFTIAYQTASLTSKEGTVWTLEFQAFYNTTVTLPQGSTLTSVSGTPISLATANGSPVVTVPPGTWKIDYGLPIQAATTSTVTAASSPSSGTQSTHASQASGLTTSVSPSSTPTTGSATSTSVGPTGTSGLGLLPYAGTVLVVGAAALFLFFRQRRSLTLDAKNSQLRPDDIKVIEFISEKGGKVIEPEIRMKFALPKTSAWRQIKRLERLGYVKVTKIGSQNQVELVKNRPTGDQT